MILSPEWILENIMATENWWRTLHNTLMCTCIGLLSHVNFCTRFMESGSVKASPNVDTDKIPQHCENFYSWKNDKSKEVVSPFLINKRFLFSVNVLLLLWQVELVKSILRCLHTLGYWLLWHVCNDYWSHWMFFHNDYMHKACLLNELFHVP